MYTPQNCRGDSDVYLQFRITALNNRIINSPCSDSMLSKQRFDTLLQENSYDMRISHLEVALLITNL